MNYELKDFEYLFPKLEKDPRKIKFKNISFTNIGRKFDAIRINRLEKKLDKAKEKALNTQIFAADSQKTIENILYTRSKAVAKLEAKITFLQTGSYQSVANVNTRAIKLRNQMMSNLEKNVYGLYSVPEEAKDEIFNNNKTNSTEQEIQEETNKLTEKIADVQAQTREVEPEDESVENFNTVTTDEVKEAVDNSFEQEKSRVENEENNENNDKINFENIANVVENDFKVNEDGTYRLKDEEIVQDSPIKPMQNITSRIPTNIETNVSLVNTESKSEGKEVPLVAPERGEDNLSKVKDYISELDKLYEELGNTSINDTEKCEEINAKIAELEDNIIQTKDKLTEEESIELEKTYNEEKSSTPKKEEDEKTEENNLSFDYSDATVNDINNNIDNISSTKDLNAMLDRIKMLKQEQAITEDRIAKAKAEEEEKDRLYNETVSKFIEYGNELEDKCNKNLEEESEIKGKAQEKQDAINSMLEAMDMTPESTEYKKR